jgi:alpha-amylase
MGVLMQAFYWDCPKASNHHFSWWNYVSAEIPNLKTIGISALWLPPVCKAKDVVSMGYDPFDFYDLGEFVQKNHSRKETWFGPKEDLLQLIQSAHNNGMQVLADLVFNHCSGGELELNPYTGANWYTKFEPASNKFKRNYDCFHPSEYESYDGGVFGGYDRTDLCHRNPYVYKEILEYCRWLIEEVGFDGFRYDCVKGYGGWITKSIQEYMYRFSPNDKKFYKPFGVGELWEDNNNQTIDTWLDEVNNFSDNPVHAFDFVLRTKLRRLCLDKHFSLRELADWNSTLLNRPFETVTFVENHDTCSPHPDVANKEIFSDKMLAYSFILTHPGYPCVFWEDYYDFNLAQSGNKSGIDALISINNLYAGGESDILYADDNLYILQRRGYNGQKGLIYVLNKIEGTWNGKRIKTQWKNTRFTPLAWRGTNDLNIPQSVTTDDNCSGDFWAPPRGYAIYCPDA